MTKKLFLALSTVALLASCQKESSIDSSLTQNREMNFAPYAGASATKGTPVNNNTAFAGDNNSFKVAAYSGDLTYFGFNKVAYNKTAAKWENQENMYWPNANATLHFGAYYPGDATVTAGYEYKDDANALSLTYTVKDEVSAQEDLMYAIADYDYTVSSANTSTDVDGNNVHLHFKHALTQVAFTAQRESDIKVTVKSLSVCNVLNSGVFTASASTSAATIEDQGSATGTTVNPNNFGSWDAATLGTTYKNYAAVMNADDQANVAIEVPVKTEDAIQLTKESDAMMLIPQALTPWNPKGESADGSKSYLAIDCVITHDDGEAPIIDGTVYIPFETKDIPYTTGSANMWKPGYKITYNLIFGGGFTDPDKPTKPGPGETPDPDDVIETLRKITYSVTVDEWIPVNGGNLDM